MLGLVQQLFRALKPSQRHTFVLLQALIVIRTVAEIAGVASVGPFMLLAADPQRLEGDGMLAVLYRRLAFDDPDHFLILLGVGAFAMLIVSSLLSITTTSALLRYAARVGAEFSARLYAYYMRQPWLFHAQTNSATLTKHIASEAAQVTRSLLTPLMMFNANIVLIVWMATALLVVDPVATLVGVGVLSLAYLLTYVLVRRRITRNGKAISQAKTLHYKQMAEGFGGIREILLRDSQPAFVAAFERTAHGIARNEGDNTALTQVPRHLIELGALGSLILVVIYLVQTYGSRDDVLLPIISIYGLAAFKLLPAFQRAYSSFATMKGAQAAFASVYADLLAALERPARQRTETAAPCRFERELRLEDVGFRYPQAPAPALEHIRLRIPAGAMVGLAGPSGAGKSTLVDLLLGLIPPQTGRFLVDDQVMDDATLPAWRAQVAFVPQAIYLADTSIAENVAFGTSEAVDLKRVEAALKAACLDELIAELPEGLHTAVGERGVKLSGGQRQRIGIARALYRDARFLVCDEATNALDAVTERKVLDAFLNARHGRTTLIVAHRLNTIRACDFIVYMEKGRIVDIGRYDELVERCPGFRELAWLA